MNDQWTGEFIGKLHNNKILKKEFAEFMGVTEQWVSTVLNGKKSAKDSEAKFNKAIDELIAKKNRKE